MLTYSTNCPTPIYHFAKRRNRTHPHRVNHKPGGKSDDSGGEHNRSYRTAKVKPENKAAFGCAFLYHCRSPPTYRAFKKINLIIRRFKTVIKNIFNKFRFNLCNFAFFVVTYTKGKRNSTNFLCGKEVEK